MNLVKGAVVVGVAGVALFAQAGFGDFLKKAAAVSDVITGDDKASSTVTTASQATTTVTTAVENPAAAATSVAQQTAAAKTQEVQATVDAATPGVVNDVGMDALAQCLQANPGLVLIDVRTPAEFASGHIPRARNIPVNVIGSRIRAVVADVETPVYVYCRIGNRSRRAAEALVAMGYKRVYDAGGISGWSGSLVR